MELSPWLTRHQQRPPLKQIATGAVGAALTIAVLFLLSTQAEGLLLAASFGSSCVLVYTLPGSPMAQPANVVGGHVIGTICGLIVAELTPLAWWSTALAVGFALTVMALLRVTHAPAGATVIVVTTTHPGWSYVVVPVLIGAIFVVVLAAVLLRLDGIRYPAPAPTMPPLRGRARRPSPPPAPSSHGRSHAHSGDQREMMRP